MQDLEERIERMHRRDRLVAGLLVLALTVTLLVIFSATSRFSASVGVRGVLAAAGSLLILFNAAAIWAMLRHNREDRTFIYTLDLKHLDEYRLQRAAERSRAKAPR